MNVFLMLNGLRNSAEYTETRWTLFQFFGDDVETSPQGFIGLLRVQWHVRCFKNSALNAHPENESVIVESVSNEKMNDMFNQMQNSSD